MRSSDLLRVLGVERLTDDRDSLEALGRVLLESPLVAEDVRVLEVRAEDATDEGGLAAEQAGDVGGSEVAALILGRNLAGGLVDRAVGGGRAGLVAAGGLAGGVGH